MRAPLFTSASFAKKLNELNFEQQIWLIVVLFTSLRTLKAVIQDLINDASSVTLTVDISILILLTLVLTLILSRKIRNVPSIVGIILTALVMFSYVQFGGIKGATEYNVMGLAVILTLGYAGRKLLIVLGTYTLLSVYCSVDIYTTGPLYQLLFKKYSVYPDNFITTLISLVIIVLYFKTLLVSENRRIWTVREKLNAQNKVIRQKNSELETQQELMEQSINELDREINKHTNHLVSQDKALEEYMTLSSLRMHPPIMRIKEQNQELRESGVLVNLLKTEIKNLDKVITELNEKLNIDGGKQVKQG